MDMARMPFTWIGTSIPGIRKSAETYCEVQLLHLPTVKAPNNLNWLQPLHPKISEAMEPYRPAIAERNGYDRRANALLAQAEVIGLILPEPFKELVQSRELQDRFPSATACYFDLPDLIKPSPFESKSHIVRFLNDQQTCVNWYISIPVQGQPIVLGSYSLEDAVFLEELNLTNGQAAALAFGQTRIVAHTLAEFLFRYWIENCIYFKLVHRLDLTSVETDYIEQIRPTE
jgi:hypothetical protein